MSNKYGASWAELDDSRRYLWCRMADTAIAYVRTYMDPPVVARNIIVQRRSAINDGNDA